MKYAFPTITIVIPTYNRPDRLAAALQALKRLHYPRDRFEVLVVDDGSPVLSEAVVKPFRELLDITLLTQPHAGPAVARNTGAAQATGTYLAFTDDDCAPAPDWLKSLAVRFAATPDCAIGGRTLNALPHDLYATASQLLIDYLYTYYNSDLNKARFLTSNNLALPAELFRAIGGFDTTFRRAGGEDREFCDRWLYLGYQMHYAPEVIVYHSHALTMQTFWKQHYNYGRGAFSFHQARARRGAGRVQLEPLSFYLNLLRYPFSAERNWRALQLAALFVVSQGANAAGFWCK